MTTVGTLTSDLGPGNNGLAGKGCIDMAAAPGNNVPLIITTAADDDKTDKLASAPIDGEGQMNFISACSKLDMEPNPFEQSFSGSGTAGSGASSGAGETKPVLPPIASMSGPLAPSAEQFDWDGPSLRMGPLSPSMLEGPQDPIMFEKTATSSSVPMGSYPATTAPMQAIFTSGAPMADPAFPMVAMPGPQAIPAGPIQTSAPYPSVMYSQSSMSQAPPQHGPSAVARHPQAFPQTNGQPTMNGRYVAAQNAGAQPADNINGYNGGPGNGLHMLSQGATAHRETWVKRESIDGTAIFQGQVTHVQHNGQPLPVMPPGMIAAPQLAKNGVEPAFVRGVQQKRMASEDSDDSRTSKQSNGSNSGEKPSKKRSVSDERMDEEEKRKNFLERNRQAALKCRQRKKQWLSNLQSKVELLTADNEQLLTHTAALKDEIIHLKALLLAHQDCPVAQANGVFPESISRGSGRAHSGGMVSHGRTPSQSMQGPPGQNLQHRHQQQPQQPQQQPGGSRGSLPAQMQTGGARMTMAGPTGSMVSNSGINGQTSVRY